MKLRHTTIKDLQHLSKKELIFLVRLLEEDYNQLVRVLKRIEVIIND